MPFPHEVRPPGAEIVDFYLKWPSSVRDAAERAIKLDLPSEVRVKTGTIRYGEPELVVVAGMGGSAIGGDLLSDLISDRARIPVFVCRDYHLPGFVKEGSLVFAVSYSGNTEETLSAFSEALRRKCMVIAMTSGGKLAYLCRKLGVPVLEVPSGMVPRAALPYLFIPLIVLLERTGAVKGLRGQVEATSELLRSMREELAPDVPPERNEAKKLASELLGTVPIIYGFGYLRAVAHRLKTQFNENSKVPSFYNWLPSLNHDEVVGWEGEEELTKHFSVIFLRGLSEEPELKARIELTRELVVGKAAKVLELHARGSNRLEEMFSVLYIGEMASLYLAFARGVNPLITPSIDAIKSGMKAIHVVERVESEVLSLIP